MAKTPPPPSEPTATRKVALPPPGLRKPGGPPAGRQKPSRTGLETIKVESRALRGRLAEDLAADTDAFDEAGKQLLKFHGVYQQDDRDRRADGRHYMFMVRSRIPGGTLTAEQYLAHDAIADAYANGTLRITTRQGIQFHGILKGDLKPAIRAINDALVTTLAACGDVVRNVMCCPLHTADPVRREVQAVTARLAEAVLPRTRAYHEIWLNGEKVYSNEPEPEPDPLYGPAYLPRKFKIGVAPPGDNCVDIYTQDVGLLAVAEEGRLLGFNVLVGGGLGMTHKRPETFPRLADALAFVPTDEVIPVVRAIIEVQRDHGDRTNRRHARMKYLIHDWGLDRFRKAVEQRLGASLAPPRQTPPLALDLHLGWQDQGDGRWTFGLSVENGRIKDEGTRRLKSGLRHLVETLRPGVHLTPNHDVLLTDIDEAHRSTVEAILEAYGIPHPDALSHARRLSMACPAMPTCGLAIAESERVMPSVIDALEAELDALGLADEEITVRMTGCPNGCARPYVADIGFVGRSLNRYTLFLGGRADGTRLNEPFEDLVPLEDLVPTIRPLLVYYRDERAPGESFGDFCHRVGMDALRRARPLATSQADHAR
ncbi:MAG: NADPH-dependent assimilatory sulfite reductase hemoprotein subunit [Bacteroidetes bacterium]|nr:sulfite reductase subunit beta [Rhodothermaceae bacterium RA]RMH53722.1 MAG: NADPH-dependent assimilatory sulfite reductase hemoprotein subunit [Bacteroidota bacterium]